MVFNQPDTKNKAKYLMQRLLQKVINRLISPLLKIIRIQHKKRYARGEGIEPFISGDTFRDLADLRIDSKQHFEKLKKSLDSSAIFCSNEVANELVKEKHIPQKKVWIFHNGDTMITQAIINALGEQKAIFAQHLIGKSNQSQCIPTGLENESWWNNGIAFDYHWLRRQKTSNRIARILWGFTVANNYQPRKMAAEVLQAYPLADRTSGWCSVIYRRILLKYMFVASPEGNGIDCIRTWEAMYLRTVPIVTRSPVTEFFVDLGLPMLMVDSWSDINKLNQNDLIGIYREKALQFDNEALYFEFWKNKIKGEIHA